MVCSRSRSRSKVTWYGRFCTGTKIASWGLLAYVELFIIHIKFAIYYFLHSNKVRKVAAWLRAKSAIYVCLVLELNLLPMTGTGMPMPNYPPAVGAGGYHPPASNQTAGYQSYPPAYSGAAQPSQPSQMPAGQTPYPGYPQGFAPYPQTTQAYTQQNGNTCMHLKGAYSRAVHCQVA